jgi:predicted TIM-barrel fold metal-dependent hydrolase
MVEIMEDLKLEDEVKENILGKNATKIFGL